MRLPARTSCSACASGPIATSSCSRASQLARRPVVGERFPRGGLDAVRHPAQRELAQRDQVALAEETVDRARAFVRHVDLAGLQTREQLVGRQVDELDLVGLVEHAVGHRLAQTHAGDLRDDVVQALEVLDVDASCRRRCPRRAAPRRPASASDAWRGSPPTVRVRELVDEQDRRVGARARRRDRTPGSVMPR